MAQSLRRRVRQRAGDRCEYCHLTQSATSLPHQLDHEIARKHRGSNAADNICLSCYYCNSFKGPNVAGVDHRTGRITRLFNPRRDEWAKHFRWRGPMLVGRTAVGRATIHVMNINLASRVEHRRLLLESGLTL
jgi:hypothetical protein